MTKSLGKETPGSFALEHNTNLEVNRMTKIKLGEKFPSFTAFDSQGNETSLNDLKGKKIVVYFYPKDDTPGCTIEANDFNKHLTSFKKKGVEIIGVSRDSKDSHDGFCEKYGLKFPLVTDDGGKIGSKLGILKETGTHIRTTFILDKEGKVEKVFENVKAEGHADELLKLLS